MRNINLIVIHCSATKPHSSIGASTIRKWHTTPKSKGGRGWSDIGYHDVIRTDGTIERGRPLYRSGAHARGHNRNSIGICLVGGIDDDLNATDNFTKQQKNALRSRIDHYLKKYPNARVVGHRDLGAKKACPCFDAIPWYYGE